MARMHSRRLFLGKERSSRTFPTKESDESLLITRASQSDSYTRAKTKGVTQSEAYYFCGKAVLYSMYMEEVALKVFNFATKVDPKIMKFSPPPRKLPAIWYAD